MPFKLSKKQLLFDLYYAFECAKKHKSNKKYVIKFELNLHDNLCKLRDELWYKTYMPSPSTCFIVNYPKKREIFAANFKDRIIHHLYYNYTSQIFENTFITDSYSCRNKKGTHYGIKRLAKHIRQESKNYTRNTFILKMDIKGYFIHINRIRLLEITNNVLNKMSNHYIKKRSEKKWGDVVDFEFLKYLNQTIILLDPTLNCVLHSKISEWDDLPKSKSLFYTNKNCGLPIGNLTSQLLSNVYLNLLDQYIKRILKCKHYGRYVDDFFIVSHDKLFLKKIIPLIEDFLKNELQLTVNKGKTIIRNYKYGIEFLGSFIKPYRIYISNNSLKRINKQCFEITHKIIKKSNLFASINSFLGVLSHYKTYNLRKKIFKEFYKFGYFNNSFTKFKLHYERKKEIIVNW